MNATVAPLELAQLRPPIDAAARNGTPPSGAAAGHCPLQQASKRDPMKPHRRGGVLLCSFGSGWKTKKARNPPRLAFCVRGRSGLSYSVPLFFGSFVSALLSAFALPPSPEVAFFSASIAFFRSGLA